MQGIDILGNSSYMGYVKSPIVSLTTIFLIVLGGLGFPVWHDIYTNTKRVIIQRQPPRRLFMRLKLQTKIVLTMTAVLLITGFLGFFVLEYKNPETMGGLNFWQKLMASGFQSVTTRTAGFASVSQAGLTSGSKLLACILMFVGGSPAGTARRCEDNDCGYAAAHRRWGTQRKAGYGMLWQEKSNHPLCDLGLRLFC